MQALARNTTQRSKLATTRLFPFLSPVKPHTSSPHLHSVSPPRASPARAFHRAPLERPGRPHFPPLKPFCASICHGSPARSREQELIDLLRGAASLPLEPESLESLDGSGIDPTAELVCSVIEQLRGEWRPALLAFKWAEKGGCVDEKVCNLIVSVLGSHEKFRIAWSLIRDLHHMKIDTRRAMLIMMDRYAAANNPSKAIWTFELMEKFRTIPDEEAFHTLLSTLCKYGNIEEAEEFMLMNRKLFPLETESFNIILDGWCNMTVDIAEAKRVWREMSRCCILPNALSYTHLISCFSKVGNLFDSLRLYDEMKKRGWTPGLEVYNSLIYVLTRENCLDESLKMLGKIKELGLKPNHATYNSMIIPLCKVNKLQEARGILSSMLSDDIEPTVETYNALLQGMGFEGTLEVLSLMRKASLGPKGDTFFLIFEKFFKLNQAENALKVWVEMRDYGVEPNLEHYKVVAHGLAASGYLVKANEIYSEMISKGFLDDPKLKKLLKKSSQRSRSRRDWNAGDTDRETRVSLRKGTMVKFNKHRHRSSKRGKKRSDGIPTLKTS